MAVSRDHELPDSRRILRLSGMLKNELDHTASMRSLPTLAPEIVFQCRLFAALLTIIYHLLMQNSHQLTSASPLSTCQSVATERITALPRDI